MLILYLPNSSVNVFEVYCSFTIPVTSVFAIAPHGILNIEYYFYPRLEAPFSAFFQFVGGFAINLPGLPDGSISPPPWFFFKIGVGGRYFFGTSDL